MTNINFLLKIINRAYQEKKVTKTTKKKKMITKQSIIGLDFLSSSRNYIIMEISIDNLINAWFFLHLFIGDDGQTK